MPHTAASAEANATAVGSAGTEASWAIESVSYPHVSCYIMYRAISCKAALAVPSAEADAAGPLSRVGGGAVRQEGRSCPLSRALCGVLL